MLTIDRTDTTLIEVPRGLANVVVAETRIGDVRGAEGFYHYRGVPAVELARTEPFESAWELVLTGAHGKDGAFAARAAASRALPEAALPFVARWGNSMGDAHALASMGAVLTFVGAADDVRPLYDRDPASALTDAIRLGAVAPTAVAAAHRAASGQQALEPDPRLDHVTDYLRMLTGALPHPRHAAALSAYMSAAIEHGFNASTFTARVIASTGADLFACAVGALGALGGPLHGGAPVRALETLDEIGDPDDAEPWIRDAVGAGRRIMGFGHAVYRTEDPRARMLREVALALRADGLAGPRVELAAEIERSVLRVLAELKPGRELHTNVEFWAAVVMEACGVPRDLFGATFAAARVVGWSAHALEQSTDTKIIRPSARYVGPPVQS